MSIGKTMSLGDEWGKLVEVRRDIDEISSELRGEEGEGRCLGALFKKVEERRARPCQAMQDGVVGVCQTNDSEEISSQIRTRLAAFSEKVAHNKAMLESIEQHLVLRTLKMNNRALPVGPKHKKIGREERLLMEQTASLERRIKDACSRLDNMPVIFLAKDLSETADVGSALQALPDEEFFSEEIEEDPVPSETEETKASSHEEKSESLSTKPIKVSDDQPKPRIVNRCKLVLGITLGCTAAAAVGVATRIFLLSKGYF